MHASLQVLTPTTYVPVRLGGGGDEAILLAVCAREEDEAEEGVQNQNQI